METEKKLVRKLGSGTFFQAGVLVALFRGDGSGEFVRGVLKEFGIGVVSDGEFYQLMARMVETGWVEKKEGKMFGLTAAGSGQASRYLQVACGFWERELMLDGCGQEVENKKEEVRLVASPAAAGRAVGKTYVLKEPVNEIVRVRDASYQKDPEEIMEDQRKVALKFWLREKGAPWPLCCSISERSTRESDSEIRSEIEAIPFDDVGAEEKGRQIIKILSRF
jgi:hypothetical protein